MLYGFLGGLLVGVPFLIFWYIGRRRGTASLQWPSVPGRVVESKLVETRDSDGDRSTTASVLYSYEVAGQTYRGNRVAIGSSSTPSATLQKYPVGREVSVFYDPKKPKSSVLEPGTQGVHALLFVGLILIGVVTIIGAVKGVTNPNGDDRARYSEAVTHYNQAEYGRARTMMEELAKKGNKEARVYLGVMAAKGQGVAQDFVEAEKWFLLAGEPGAKNAEQVKKGLTPEQWKEAQARAAAYR